MSLDATVGGANANTYATLDEATAYQSTRTFTTSWEDADTDVKEAALVQAARLIDAVFKWTGSAVDDVQARSWPRSGMFTRNGYAIATTVIPQELKDAQSEYARQLVDNDLAASLDQDTEGLASVKAGPIEVKFRQPTSASLTLMNAQLKLQSPDFLYLDKIMPPGVRVLLVPSWYEQASLIQKAFLRARR